MRKYRQRNFRPTPENEKRLESAASIGLNVSEMINELIREHFKSYAEKKSKALTALASSSN